MKPENNQNVFLAKVEKMVNRVLSLDEEALASMTTLSGNVVEIDILNTEFGIFIIPSENGVRLEPDYKGKPDVAIKGSPSALLGMISAEKIGAGDIEINGNVGLAQKFQSTLRNLEIDWEECLSKYTGDIAAHKIGNFFRRVSRYVTESGKTIGMDISEYLRYEKQALLDKSEIEEFNHAVDEIRDDVERLQKAIEKLERKTHEAG